MEDKIHVLHVVGRTDVGGAESRIMDLFRNIDRNKIIFDFIQHTTDICAYQKDIEMLGGRVYSVPRFRVVNFFRYRQAWKRFFKDHPEIQVVHGHMTSTAAIYLPVAKKHGKYTIAHARSAGVDKGLKGILTKFMRRNLARKCDCCLACSKLAGSAVFGAKAMRNGTVMLFPNAIEADRFCYDPAKRQEIRNKLGIADKTFVIGHVGRFSPVKNHEMLLMILEGVLKEKLDVILLLVGDGERRKQIEEKAGETKLISNVIFAGNQRNVQDYYQAMDFFLLPSFYEGLPGTAIEAQACGLSGIISDRVTGEAIITELMVQKGIDGGAGEWVHAICQAIDVDREQENIKDRALEKRYARREHWVRIIKEQGYDVKLQAQRLQDIYAKAVKNLPEK